MATTQKVEPGNTVATVDPSAQQSYIVRSPIGRILTAPAASSILSKVLPAGASVDRFLYECYHAVTQNPEILECTEQSIILAVGRAIESGLVIGRGVHLVPVNTKVSKRNEPDRYEKRLQAWLDYRGEIELVRRAGVARHVDGHPVYENEPFEIRLGTRPSIEHTPILDAAKRGKLIGGYAYAILPGNLIKVFHMTLGEVDDVRAKSKSWKSLPETPPWYVVKSVIHRVVKTLPTNPALLKIITLMEREEIEDTTDTTDAEPLGAGEASNYMLSPRAPRQLMPAADPSNPYQLDVSGGAQPRTVETRVAPPVTEAQRASAASAAGAGDPYHEERLVTPSEPATRGRTPVLLPFPQGQAKAGTPLRGVSDKDLSDAVRFAGDVTKYSAFAEAATSELEQRAEERRFAAADGEMDGRE